MTYQWLTTQPNPNSSATGVNAGQRGWKTHAVISEPSENFIKDIKRRQAICGLRPRHGWGLDLFIEDKCERCLKRIGRDNVRK